MANRRRNRSGSRQLVSRRLSLGDFSCDDRVTVVGRIRLRPAQYGYSQIPPVQVWKLAH